MNNRGPTKINRWHSSLTLSNKNGQKMKNENSQNLSRFENFESNTKPMAVPNGGADDDVEVIKDDDDDNYTRATIHRDDNDNDEDEDETLYGVFSRLIADIFFPGSTSSAARAPLFHRIKASLSQNSPLLREASRNTGRSVLVWTRSGSPLRALLVISVGTITIVALTGLLVFMLFFLAATFNAIVISVLLSLAAAGGFLAFFFACVVGVYIGALSIAIFVVSTTTISAIVAVLITTGWIGFFWLVWLAGKKSLGLARRALRVTGSTISAYSYARPAHKSSG